MRLLLAALVFLAIPAAAQASFTEEEVTIDSVEGVTLAATVSIPAGEGPFAAVVLVSGSGVQDRDGGPGGPPLPDGYLMYRQLAHALTEAGVLVLRYDERGAGASTAGSDPANVTTRDYALDAAAAARALADRADVRWVGIVGHSEGGVVAPLVANAEDAVDGIVILAGQAVSGREIVLEQNRIGLTGAGVSEAALVPFLASADSAFVRLAASAGGDLDDASYEAVQEHLTAAFGGLPDEEAAKLGLNAGVVPLVVAQQMQGASSAWFRTFLAIDPAEVVAALDVPTLALYLALDQQVAPAQNAGPMREALGASRSPDWEVTTLDGVNHVLQRAETGAATEYATLEATVDPSVPAAIAEWVLSTAGGDE